MISYPNHSLEILYRHTRKVQLRNTTHTRLRESRNKVLESLAPDAIINNLYAVLNTAELQDKIKEADLSIQEPIQIILTVVESSKHDYKWRTYQDRERYLQTQRGKSFSIIRGQ